jgi:hypothetical protein
MEHKADLIHHIFASAIKLLLKPNTGITVQLDDSDTKYMVMHLTNNVTIEQLPANSTYDVGRVIDCVNKTNLH